MSEILIISKADFELTTNSVCDWLNHYGVSFVRLNVDRITDPACYDLFFNLNDHELEILDKVNHRKIDLKKIKVVWCRRFIDMVYEQIVRQENEVDENVIRFAKFHAAERNRFLRILYDFYPEWKWFDYYKDSLKIDKIEVLRLAKKQGLTVPETYIANSRDSLQKILDLNKDLITKPIFEGVTFSDFKGMYGTHTQPVKKCEIEAFTPSLFQENINKKFELRIFYLNGTFYPMAIFSSANSRTQTDFRNYDIFNPNRCVPYELPQDIKEKLTALLADVHLTSGSIDMIKDIKGRYVFLEINPVGQFGMVSRPCNYYLEKEVAEFLIQQKQYA
ncbi:grasp-with-spasm system ATP-grasp peptide maturase [Chryseobacterium sp. SN22]|uniref:grasp-with-spasm system ATP-grasp peptide maturase n=1 Tax=Chryseobacterium sp. SN22 TaxID=2606431 RepID=UPI0011EC46D3|nr:grasp-with-spasm system ATP-grasp peptide maturase [Chryseobacterium sp. SN22]KAA0130692.1 grasp-with-spasm system ATP-grasp peptide maturase [Chryseobacterium sp. SN22]